MRADSFDIALAYDWEYDLPFIYLFEKMAQSRGYRTFIVHKGNLEEVLEQYRLQQIQFKCLIDRASDTSVEFYQLQLLCEETGSYIFEPLKKLRWASDKATMHLEFISNQLHTPYTIILPPYSLEPEPTISENDLAQLGIPFVIKPANTTGGGVGVVKNATRLKEVQEIRRQFPQDKILLQRRVVPIEKQGERFWFRCFYACDDVYLTWWNDLTHRYREISSEQWTLYQLDQLEQLVRKVASICQLNFFSTEICFTAEHDWVVVDYVNEICDLRLQSQTPDGVPDNLVNAIIQSILNHLNDKISKD